MFKDTFCMTFSLPQSSKKTFSSSLRENGLRPTKQRACVYWVILGKRDHPTADDIYDRVRKHLPGTSFATVYNCLETLVGCGLVRQVNLDRSPTRYCPNLTPMPISNASNQARFMMFKLMKIPSLGCILLYLKVLRQKT